jgi:NADPH:quinone reductase
MNMVKGIHVYRPGGVDALVYEDIPIGAPGPGEVRIRHHSIGLNYIDIYFRDGSYPVPSLPFVPGNEGAGEVVAVGEGVTGFQPGDRVAYAATLGSYAEERMVPAHFLVKLPDAIDYDTGAAMMLKGMTAQYLLRRTFKVVAGQTILMHAAAGGVGLIACQWAKALGCTVIGTVGSREKESLARENGCDHVIFYRDEDFAARVKEITKGAMCDVVYDGVGKATFPGSLDCLKPFGMFVSFGAASGAVDAFNIGLLAQKGSLYAARPTLFTHMAKREDVVAITDDLFDMVSRGVVQIPVHARFGLRDAGKAHIALESRKTTGATVLLP